MLSHRISLVIPKGLGEGKNIINLKGLHMEAKSSNSDRRKTGSSFILHAKKLMWLERQARKERSGVLNVSDDFR
jgi:hypothetical protein